MPQRNALLPPSRNALQADPVQQLLKQASEAPQYGELVDYLSARRAMPPIQQRPLGVSGSFDYNTAFGDDLPRTGVVTLGFNARPATVVHELTHAAERQIHDQAFALQRKGRNQKLNNEEKQFLDAYSKLMLNAENLKTDPRQEMFGRLEPGATKEAFAHPDAKYRLSGKELSAFGMGNAALPSSATYRVAQHLDPTMATEFSVLLDLANRLQRQQPPQGR